MAVSIENQSGASAKIPALRKLAEYVLRAERADANSEVSVALVDNEVMRDLNRRFRSLDEPTDVLAFELGSEGELSGEVVIAPAVALEQAQEAQIPVTDEIEELLVHGLLHLLGYGHEGGADAEKMFARQAELRRDFAGEGA